MLTCFVPPSQHHCAVRLSPSSPKRAPAASPASLGISVSVIIFFTFGIQVILMKAGRRHQLIIAEPLSNIIIINISIK